jgi:hypothetical protein
MQSTSSRLAVITTSNDARLACTLDRARAPLRTGNSQEMVKGFIEAACDHGADMIVTPCPVCQMKVEVRRHQRHRRHQAQEARGLFIDPDGSRLQPQRGGRRPQRPDHPGQAAGGVGGEVTVRRRAPTQRPASAGLFCSRITTGEKTGPESRSESALVGPADRCRR